MSACERERGKEVLEGDLSCCRGAESQRMFGYSSPDRRRCRAGRGGGSGVKDHAIGATPESLHG